MTTGLIDSGLSDAELYRLHAEAMAAVPLMVDMWIKFGAHFANLKESVLAEDFEWWLEYLAPEVEKRTPLRVANRLIKLHKNRDLVRRIAREHPERFVGLARAIFKDV